MKRPLAALLLCLAALAPCAARAQELAEPAQVEVEALRVFLDCRSRYCDFDHFRREIDFVNYVRDRVDAQVHVLVTTRRTGGGGTEFTIAYIGQQEFAGADDTLFYFSSDTDVEDEVRAGLTRLLKLGLVRYVARLPMGERLDVTYEVPDTVGEAPQVQALEDPWDFWIFRIRVGGNLGGEERQSSFSANWGLSANRTTEAWKIRLSASGWYSEDQFELSDGSELTSISRNYGGAAFVVKSLGEHWSVGAIAEARVSTFRNQDFSLEIGPGVEYSVFPYAESTRRELTVIAALLVNYFDYEEITIFDKMTETRPRGVIEVEYAVQQPFGTINTSLEGVAFLDDFEQHSIELGGWLNLRLVRGLQLNIHGSVERIKDQLHLERAGATDEEVLLRRKELGTDYRYSVGLSLSYTFGSIYNNVVNPRFD